MSESLATIQQTFMRELRGDADHNTTYSGPSGGSAESGMVIYRDSYHAIILQQLQHAYPATQQLLGESAFLGLARDVIHAEAVSQANIFSVAEILPNYLASLPTVVLPRYAIELIHYEHRVAVSQQQVATQAITWQECLDLSAAEQKSLHLSLSVNHYLFSSYSNTMEIWQALIEKSTIDIQTYAEPQYFLIWADHCQHHVRALTDMQWHCCQLLKQPILIADFIQQAEGLADQVDAITWLQQLSEAGRLTVRS